MIDNIARWSFNIGVILFFIGIILIAFGVSGVWSYLWPSIPMMIIPRACWAFRILKDPYEND